MLKKFFIISFFLALAIIGFNSSYIIVSGEEVEFSYELESGANNLFEKGLRICREVSGLADMNLINTVNGWYSNLNFVNDFSGIDEAMSFVVYIGSFILLPVQITLNFVKFIFNCFNILVGNKISIQPDTSYGGGGGSFVGGR